MTIWGPEWPSGRWKGRLFSGPLQYLPTSVRASSCSRRSVPVVNENSAQSQAPPKFLILRVQFHPSHPPSRPCQRIENGVFGIDFSRFRLLLLRPCSRLRDLFGCTLTAQLNFPVRAFFFVHTCAGFTALESTTNSVVRAFFKINK